MYEELSKKEQWAEDFFSILYICFEFWLRWISNFWNSVFRRDERGGSSITMCRFIYRFIEMYRFKDISYKVEAKTTRSTMKISEHLVMTTSRRSIFCSMSRWTEYCRMCSTNSDSAPSNVLSRLVTWFTFHLEISALNDDASWNALFILVTWRTFHLEISTLNNDASSNKLSRLVTRYTFQPEISALKSLLIVLHLESPGRAQNTYDKSVTPETSQNSIIDSSQLRFPAIHWSTRVLNSVLLAFVHLVQSESEGHVEYEDIGAPCDDHES